MRVSETQLQAIGAQFWAALDLDGTFATARQAAGSRIFPLIVASDQAEVQQLPWETLYHPQRGFLGKAPGFTLARRLPQVNALPPELQPGPLRVLLFTVLPDDDQDADSSRLDVEEAQAQVQDALAPWVGQGLVRLEMPDDGRFATLQQLLQSFKPHLLFHFGHGNFIYQPHSGRQPYATLQFEDDAGGSEAIDEKTYAQAFFGAGVSCVVLSACESGMTASQELNNGLAWRLAQMGLPHVIGMRESIMQDAGIPFHRSLCDDLAQQERVDVALQRARLAINTPLKDSPLLAGKGAGLRELSLGQWCLPALISPNGAQPLIDWRVHTATAAAAPGQPDLEQRQPAAALFGPAHRTAPPRKPPAPRRATPVIDHRPRRPGQNSPGRQAGPGSGPLRQPGFRLLRPP